MKIGIPVETDNGLESQVAQHFGQASLYAIVDSETKDVKVIPNESNHRGGKKAPPTWLKEDIGIDVLICTGAGSRAIGLFEEIGIPVYFGTLATVGEMLREHAKGTLQLATPADGCTH
jgi:predicted Fe-Mo cluster-binding NifX family protein